MKNFLIIILIILIIGGTGYAVYHQVDEFNKKQELESSSTTTKSSNQVSIDMNSTEAKDILNLLDIVNNQDNTGLQSIFINLEGETNTSNLTNDNKQNIIYYSALKQGLLKDETNTNAMCRNGCKSILKTDAQKIGTSFGISDLDSIYTNDSKVNDTYIYADKKPVIDSALLHDVSIVEVENSITLTDKVTVQYKDTSKPSQNKTVKYEISKQSDNQYILNKITIES